jgi:hypothetical protein
VAYREEDEKHECIISVKCGDNEYGMTLILSISSEREGEEFVDVVRRWAGKEWKKMLKHELQEKTFMAHLQASTYKY